VELVSLTQVLVGILDVEVQAEVQAKSEGPRLIWEDHVISPNFFLLLISQVFGDITVEICKKFKNSAFLDLKILTHQSCSRELFKGINDQSMRLPSKGSILP